MIDPSAVVTPLTEDEAVKILSDELWTSLGADVNENYALYLLALAWVETERGKSIVGNNPGNLMAKGFNANTGKEYSVWSGAFWRPNWYYESTTDTATRARMFKGEAPSAFRSYPTAVDGWRDYLKLLTVPKNAPIVRGATADDPEAFVSALQETYSPDYNEKHIKTFRDLVDGFRLKGYFREFRAPSEPTIEPVDAKPSRSFAFAIVALLATVAAVFAFGKKKR